MNELKPCPNCQHNNIFIVQLIYPKHRYYYAFCTFCGLCGESKWFKFSAKRAWNMWNRRTTDE